MSELDRIKTAKAQLIESVKYTGSLDDRLKDIEKAFDPLLAAPQLNEYQQTVLEWSKRESYDSYFESTIRNLYYYLNRPKLNPLFKTQAFVESYNKTNDKQMAQVIQAFTDWWLSENE